MSKTDKLDMVSLEKTLKSAIVMTPSLVLLDCIDDRFQNNIKYLEDCKCNVGQLLVLLQEQVKDDTINADFFAFEQAPPTKDMISLIKHINNVTNTNQSAPTFEDIVTYILQENSKNNTTFTEVTFALKASGYNPVEVVQNTKYKTINKYCIDLVIKAQNNKIDPLIGRESEVERIIEILAHQKKKNPLLVGDAGVGKTQIIEGLASAIAQDRVPEPIKGAKIFSTSIAALIAGTKFRGDVEEKLGQLVDEIKRYEYDTQRPAYLFIDEIHQIVGAGGSGGDKDGSNIANILKPDLASGDLSLIGATTEKEYKRTIQKDDALNRRMQVVRINPPSDAQTIEIIRKGAGPVLASYHGVRFSKAVIEAAVKLSSKYITDKAQPDKAISIIDSIGARLRTTENRDSARVSDVENLISTITGTPITAFKQKVGKDEYIDIESKLNEVVFGQAEAVKKIAEIYERSKAGLSEEGQPIGSVLLVGPTGVGKTEVAKSLAEITDAFFIKMNMGEYTEEHSVSKLFGSPAGYIGYNDGGQLTNIIRKNPHSILLLDEIEKAHPKVFEALLGIIDGGKMVSGEGDTVDFSNVMILMTSNVGATVSAARRVIDIAGTGSLETAKSQVSAQALKSTFSPEFRNKLSGIFTFNPLGPAEVKRVSDKFLNKAKEALKTRKGICIKFNESVYEYISTEGFSIEYGARPVKKLINAKIIDVLVRPLLKGEIKAGDTVYFDVSNNDIIYSINEGINGSKEELYQV